MVQCIREVAMRARGVSFWSFGLLFLIGLSGGIALADNSPYRAGNRIDGWRGESKDLPPDTFLDKVQPILSQRCVACHGCYEAPCQLNLQTYEGFRRGYNPEPIFSAKRIWDTKPTRPFDATSINEWRQMHFLPVVPDNLTDTNENPKASVMYELLELGSKNESGFSLAGSTLIQKQLEQDSLACVATPEQLTRHFATDNKWKVVSTAQYKTNGLVGMPLGFPKLKEDAANNEKKTLTDWIEAGTPGPSPEATAVLTRPSTAASKLIADWEAFLNGPSAQAAQSARYIYEHVFTTAIHFSEAPGEYYELVRTKSADGPVVPLKTLSPVDDPGVRPFFYRFRKHTGPLVQKSLVPWRLSREKLAHIKHLFMDSKWPQPVPHPVYGSRNQFAYFAPIPAMVRSRFMLENAKVIVQAMTHGTVCVGSQATYAISDHFGAWFLKPESDVSVLYPDLGMGSLDQLATAPEPWLAGGAILDNLKQLDFTDGEAGKLARRAFAKVFKATAGLTGSKVSDNTIAKYLTDLHGLNVRGADLLGALIHFIKSSDANANYQASYERQLRIWLKHKANRPTLTYNDIWTGGSFDEHADLGLDGDQDPTFPAGKNPNAWLVITRHEKSASVQYGPEDDYRGGVPQSRWVMTYSNFERLYSNLVLHYNAWGSVLHKLATWRHMSYVRLEGEDFAISFLPPAYRAEVRRRFAKGILEQVNELRIPQQSLAEMYDDPPATLAGPFGVQIPNPLGLGAPYLPPRDGVPGSDAGSADASIIRLVDTMQSRLEHLAIPSELERAVPAVQTAWEDRLKEFSGKTVKAGGVDPTLFPNVTYVRVAFDDKTVQAYSILVDAYYLGHNLVFAQDLNRESGSDTLALYRGFVGPYPNLFLDVPADKRDEFIEKFSGARTRAGWQRLIADFAVKRNEQAVWDFYDWVNAWKADPHPGNDPAEQGLPDLSQFLFVSR
jgi:hypothetical protein